MVTKKFFSNSTLDTTNNSMLFNHGFYTNHKENQIHIINGLNKNNIYIKLFFDESLKKYIMIMDDIYSSNINIRNLLNK